MFLLVTYQFSSVSSMKPWALFGCFGFSYLLELSSNSGRKIKGNESEGTLEKRKYFVCNNVADCAIGPYLQKVSNRRVGWSLEIYLEA